MEEALEYMNKVCSLLPLPGIIYSTVKLANEARNFDIAIDLLEKMLERDPRNIDILEKLALIFYTKGDFTTALTYFKQLYDLEPTEAAFLMNLGSCYVQTGDLHKALDVFNEICTFDNAPLAAFLSRSYVLSHKDTVKAFESLLSVKEIYWENPQYLQSFFVLAFKAGKEESGHSALLQLKKLQQEGKAPQEILMEKRIEELNLLTPDYSLSLHHNISLLRRVPIIVIQRYILFYSLMLFGCSLLRWDIKYTKKYGRYRIDRITEVEECSTSLCSNYCFKGVFIKCGDY